MLFKFVLVLTLVFFGMVCADENGDVEEYTEVREGKEFRLEVRFSRIKKTANKYDINEKSTDKLTKNTGKYDHLQK